MPLDLNRYQIKAGRARIRKAAKLCAQNAHNASIIQLARVTNDTLTISTVKHIMALHDLYGNMPYHIQSFRDLVVIPEATRHFRENAPDELVQFAIKLNVIAD
jgi:hypothetical protein